MEPFLVSVHPELDEFGAMLPLVGVLDQTEYKLGEEVLSTPEGISYDLMLSNTGEGVLLSGTVSAEAHGVCGRCLKPVTEHVEAEAEGYYLFEAAEELEGYEEDEFEVVSDEGAIDVSGPIEAALVYGTPFVLLCDADCKGLCPKCGADLNEGACACDADDGIDPDNPFAVLKNLNFDDGDNS